MPRPRSSTFYLPLAPVDAPLSLKAKLSVLPPQAANALLAPRGLPPCQESTVTTNSCSSSAVTTSAASTTTTSGFNLAGLNCHTPPVEDECARLERVLGLTNNGNRRTTRRHTDAPLPLPYSGTLPPPRPLPPLQPSYSSPPTPALTDSSSTESIPELDDEDDNANDQMDLDTTTSSNPNPNPATRNPGQTSSGSLRVPTQPTDSPTPTVTPESKPQAQQQESASSLFSELASSDLESDLVGAPSRLDGERMDLGQDNIPLGSQMIADWRTAEAHTLSSCDMDSFADACSSTSSTSSSSSSTFGFPSHTHRPSSSSINVTPPSTSRTPLSNLPCGIASVLACRSKLPSSLCSSFTLDTEENNSSRHDPLSHAYHVLVSKSLHPLDMRHLLPRHFRQTYPPPPPPPYVALPLPPIPEQQQQPPMVVAFVDSSIPGLVEECPMVEDVEELTESDSSSTPTSSSTMVPAPVPRPTLPPRQRFRLAPLYIHKVLRRTLGTTAWARAETLSYARVAERRCGYSYSNRDDPFAGPGGLENGLLSCGPGGAGASLVWGGYEDAFGMLSSFGMSNGVDNALGGSCGWDLDLEDEDDEEEDGDFDEEDLEAIDVDHPESEQDLQQEQELLVVEEDMPFVREGAPEPEERPLAVIQLDVPSKEEDDPERRPRSPSGYGGYNMVGRFTWEKAWSPVSPGVESGWPTSIISTSASTSTTTSTLSTPVSASSPEDGETRETFWDMDEDEKPGGPPATPYQSTSSTSTYKAASSSSTPSTSLYLKTSAPRLRRDDGEEEEEEEIFRYSPLQIDDGWNAMDHDHHHHLSIEDHDHIQDGCSCTAYLEPQSPLGPNYLHPSSPSSMNSGPPISPPAPISPSFPPAPLVGTKISSGCSSSEDEISEEEYEDVEMSPQHFTPPPTASSSMRSQRIKAPRPLALVQQPQTYYPAYVDDSTSPATGVFVIPPSPLNHSTFGQPQQQQQQGSGPTTPTASSHCVPAPPPPAAPQSAPVYVHERPTPMEIHERLVSSKKSYERIGSRQSFERIESRRSFERIESRRSVELPERRTAEGETVVIAPRPQRASRALENMFGMESPKIHAGALPSTTTNTMAATTMSNPTSPSTSASAASTGRAAWTFGSLKSALSNSVSHLVELARSRSPSPLPWLMRSTVTSTTATLAGAAAALNNGSSSSETTPRAHEDLEFERASCVTPTPMDRSRRSSTTTITQSTIKRASAGGIHVPQLNLQAVANSTNENQSSSPPPKRTLSTSSLSSLSSEPDSESGSSGGMFSRSPSPEPSSDARIWDPSYSLTPRSRPISADAKTGPTITTAATTHGGQLSPMVIPGSWDPEELWSDDVGVSKW